MIFQNQCFGEFFRNNVFISWIELAPRIEFDSLQSGRKSQLLV